jgi:predicted SnoaL-like aldol condensation-catalyzing enzyme
MPEVKILRWQSVLVTSILALLASACPVSAQSTAAAKPATAPPAAAQSLADRNRAVALRVFEEIFNQRRPEVAAEIYSPNFRNHGIHSDVSLEVDQGWARGELQAFPDLHITVVKTVADNDLVTILWIFRGTHARYGYSSFPPTGTHMELRGITIFRVVDGRIVEEWTTSNLWSAYSQALHHLRWWIIAAVCLFLLAWLYLGHLVFKWLGRRRSPVPVG